MKSEEQLVEENMKLVYYIANKYPPHTALPVEDRVQEGSIGLLNAIRRYDPSKNVTFSAFAGMYIEWAINNAIRNCTPVKVSTDVMQFIAYMKKHDLIGLPVEELIGRPKGTRTVVEQALAFMETEFTSLDFELGWRNGETDDVHKLVGFDEDFETSLIFEKVFEVIPEHLRDTFRLYIKGYSAAESANMLGTEERKVKSDRQAIRYKLRKNKDLIMGEKELVK